MTRRKAASPGRVRQRQESFEDKRERLTLEIARQVPFDGWTKIAMERGAEAANVSSGEMKLMFPRGVRDVIAAFSAWADAQMLVELDAQPRFDRWRVRDKVAFAVQSRLTALWPYRDAVRRLLPWAALPYHAPFALEQTYRTLDAIWRAAGDTSTDFNFYTKRGLLAFVLKATTLHWLDDESEGQQDSWAFLDRRIAEVLRVGQGISAVKSLNPSALFGFILKRAAG